MSNVKLTEPNTVTWKTKDGRKIPFAEMDDDHLQKALIIVERNEYNLWMKQRIFIDLRDAIEEEAEKRNIELLDIDQTEDSNKYKNYFSSRSKRRNETRRD